MTDKTRIDDEKKSDMPKQRILLADKLGPFVETTLQQNGYEVVCDASLNDDSLREQMEKMQPNVLVVRSTKVNKQHLSASSSLSLVIRAGAGFDTIDVNSASAMGIFIANCPGKNAIAVAELALGHLINCDRRISENVQQLREGKWNKKGFGKGARGLYGRTLAVLGVGNIGSLVCARALGFGMKVRGYSRHLTQERAAALGITRCASMEEAVTGADAVSIHLPHNDGTHHCVNKELLCKLKDNAYVVNTSRGGVVHEQDMVHMIEQKGLRYAADVYEHEPKATDKEFNDEQMKHASVFGSHHIGASTEQASEAVGAEVLNIIQTFLGSGQILHCVNLEEHSPATHSVNIRHKDEVGVLAEILQTLKAGDINIQEMNNIVFRGAKSASATLSVDKEPTQAVLQKIKQMANVYGIEVTAK
eukprot:CAMPEP_0202727856 /NCGR_PEP_ID=MMETSP1385-20130828/185331_1 /ASSEMBLY_ACC=CAM_ASM_000861 /TAXON_ID=933848 /ORGANISM="Elphidium margaritaceum" /LENGTH=418 /DNA_ID=CAMNT_0049394099 /DNA_START=982 /DNA_END=2238 /DNA_ORIENTATION=+